MNAKYALGRYSDSIDSLERLHLELHEVLKQYEAVNSSSHVLDGIPHGSNVSNPTLQVAVIQLLSEFPDSLLDFHRLLSE